MIPSVIKYYNANASSDVTGTPPYETDSENNDAANTLHFPENPVEPTALPLTPTPTPVGFVSNSHELKPFELPHLLSDIDNNCLQIVVIVVTGSKANYWLVEKIQDVWYNVAGPFYCRTGREGLTITKTEGDAKTPAGFTYLNEVYYNGDFQTLMPLTQIQPGAVWVTDSNSEYYNTYTNISSATAAYNSSKPMPAGQYDIYLDIGYNPECNPGMGSAIFIRTSKSLSVPTSGEISVSYNEMVNLLSWLDPGKYPACGIFDAYEYGWVHSPVMDGSFAYISDYLKYAVDELMYATDKNPLGQPVSGYSGNYAVASTELINALGYAENELYYMGYGLVIYDAYKPKRAVTEILSWLSSLTPDSAFYKELYYPDMTKKEILNEYRTLITEHSRGIAVDVGLYRLSDGEIISMGTLAGSFSKQGAYGSTHIRDEESQNREILRAAMERAGFSACDKQWWHFTLESEHRVKEHEFCIAQPYI